MKYRRIQNSTNEQIVERVGSLPKIGISRKKKKLEKWENKFQDFEITALKN